MISVVKRLISWATKGRGVRVGDHVQWTSQGVAQFAPPRRVTSVSPDGQWAFVEGSGTGLPVGQLTATKRSS
jgi:hypothetical protein